MASRQTSTQGLTGATVTQRTPQARTRKPSPRFNLRLGDWGVVVNFEKGFLEVFRAGREGLAHLSLFLNAREGGFNFHLTFDHDAFEQGLVEQKAYVPLLRVSAADLEKAGALAASAVEHELRAWVSREFRRFHPDALRRAGYGVWVTPRAEGAQLFARLAPRSREKYRLDPAWEQMLVSEARQQDIFAPGILTHLERLGVRAGLMPDSEYLVTAMKLDGEQHEQISLSFDRDRHGRQGWWGIPHSSLHEVSEALMMRFFDWLRVNATDEHRTAWEHVVTGLGLHETDAGRVFADNVRQTLRGRNPVTHPFRSG